MRSNTVADVLDAGEGAVSAWEDGFATSRDGTEEGEGGEGMYFEVGDGDESAPTSDSDDKAATDESRGAEEECDGEHKENNNDEQAGKVWRALSISLAVAVGREGGCGK